jgi:predicted phage tail protein
MATTSASTFPNISIVMFSAYVAKANDGKLYFHGTKVGKKVRNQRSEVRGQKSEVRSQILDLDDKR